MRKKLLYCLGIAIIMVSVNFSNIVFVHAGSKDMVAGKREKFKDDNADSLQDLFEKREAENEVYKEKMMSNSDQTVSLLEEIRDMLRQLKEDNDE